MFGKKNVFLKRNMVGFGKLVFYYIFSFLENNKSFNNFIISTSSDGNNFT